MVKGLIDTGASFSCINQDVFKILNKKKRVTDLPTEFGNGTSQNVPRYEINIRSLGGHKFNTVKFGLLQNRNGLILGRDCLKLLGIKLSIPMEIYGFNY